MHKRKHFNFIYRKRRTVICVGDTHCFFFLFSHQISSIRNQKQYWFIHILWKKKMKKKIVGERKKKWNTFDYFIFHKMWVFGKWNEKKKKINYHHPQHHILNDLKNVIVISLSVRILLPFFFCVTIRSKWFINLIEKCVLWFSFSWYFHFFFFLFGFSWWIWQTLCGVGKTKWFEMYIFWFAIAKYL